MNISSSAHLTRLAMTSSVADPKRLMLTTRRFHISEHKSAEWMKKTVAASDGEDTFDALADHVVSGEYLAEEKCQMRAERSEKVSQGIL